MFAQFVYDEDGSTAIEYALIGSLLAIVAIAALRTVGQKMSDMYSLTIAENLPG